MDVPFSEACKQLQEYGFSRVAHKVVIHHMRKDFLDYDVTRDSYYIKRVGLDFIHVAVIEFQTESNKLCVTARYTQAADDLLYGLRIKYREGHPSNVSQTLFDIWLLTTTATLANNDQYVRRRFGRDRTKAKTRAFFVMISDLWKMYWPFAK